VAHTSPIAMAALVDRLVNAKKALNEVKARGTVIAYPEGKSVLVIAPPNEHATWKKLVADFDQAQPVTTVNYTPRRFGVRETAKLIEQVVFGGTEPTGGARVVVDDLTGTLVVTATPSDQIAISDLMERLESTEFGPRRMLRSFPIKNRSVKDVAALLEKLLEQGILDEADEVVPAEPIQGPTAPMPAKTGSAAPPLVPTNQKGSDVTLTADESTNRLIALGEGRALEQIARLIDTLDLRASQVMVETMVVTLNDTQTMDLAVELQALGTAGDTFYRLGSLFGFGSPVF
jgi:type II secretory pathway component GspD/PulD (secretin)